MAGPNTRRATAIVQAWSSRVGSGAPLMRVPGLARKFWTITSWMCPCRSCTSRIASSASMRSARVSPMPIRMPVVNGDTRASRRLERGQAHRRDLVGRAEVRAAPPRQPLGGGLQHDALRHRHLAQAREPCLVHHAGIEMRQQPRLLQHQRRRPLEIVERRLGAERPQGVAGGGVAQLRLVAQREQRLLAAGRLPPRAMSSTASGDR